QRQAQCRHRHHHAAAARGRSGRPRPRAGVLGGLVLSGDRRSRRGAPDRDIRGPRCFTRRQGEALHPEREPLLVLGNIRRTIGEYNFAGQYQQSPAPLGGGLVKVEWFKRYGKNDLPERFDYIVQSWDTANKATELSDFTMCTTWGIGGKKVHLLGLLREGL